MNNKIAITRGDTKYLEVFCTDGYTLSSGDRIDFTVRKNLTSSKVIEKSVTSFTSGKGVITIEPDDTSDLEFGEYLYDVQLTMRDSGDVQTIVTPSTFEVMGEVSY